MSIELKIAAFESLLAEVGSALAELVETAQNNEALIEKVAVSISGLCKVLDRPAADMAGLVAALKGLNIAAPAVNVKNEITVPVPVVNNVIQSGATVDYEMSVKYDKLGRIETARLIASPQRSAKALPF